MSRNDLKPSITNWVFGLVLTLGMTANQAMAARVHLIAVGDTLDKKIGEDVVLDIQNLTWFLEKSGRKSLLPPKILIGPDCNPMKIAESLDRIKLQPDDAIIFYYSGHGAYDATTGQVMQIPRLGDDGVVSRNEIRKRLEGLVDDRQIRLAVLMTDMCNLQKIIKVPDWPIPGAMAAAPQELSDDDPIFKALFVDSVGFVDVSSASTDEAAAIYPKFVSTNDQLSDGSIFTTVVTDLMARNSKQRFSWDYFLKEMVAPKVRQEFQKNYPDGIDLPDGVNTQRTQTVLVSSTAILRNGPVIRNRPVIDMNRGIDAYNELRRMPANPGIGPYIESIDVTISPRLVPRNFNGKILYGIRILETRLNNPVIANWEPNDVIYSINGQEIRTIANFRRLVANLGPGAFGAWWKASINDMVRMEPIVFGQNNFRPPGVGGMNNQVGAKGKPRLGVQPEIQIYSVQTAEGPKNGVRVGSIVPGSPASNAMLDPGDIILEINDIPTPTLDAFYKAIEQAGDVIQIRGRNVRTGEVENFPPIPINPR